MILSMSPWARYTQRAPKIIKIVSFIQEVEGGSSGGNPPISRMVTSGGPPLDPSKLHILIILGALWVYRALGDMLSIIVSNSLFGRRSFFGSIFYPMSPTLCLFIYEILLTRASGHFWGISLWLGGVVARRGLDGDCRQRCRAFQAGKRLRKAVVNTATHQSFTCAASFGGRHSV